MLTIMTLNVHMWMDSDGRDNMDALTDWINGLPKNLVPDVLCLQEAVGTRVCWLQVVTNMTHVAVNRDNVILVKKELRSACKQLYPTNPGVLTHSPTTVRSVGLSLRGLPILCLHLDHEIEDDRLREIEELRQGWGDVFDQAVLVGDFNALTEGDCSVEHARRVAEARRQGQWEAPRFDVMRQLSESHQDLSPPLPDDLGTSRFQTRIDYILWPRKRPVSSYKTCIAFAPFTDHCAVVTSLVAKAM